jgi:hypothetical protein
MWEGTSRSTPIFPIKRDTMIRPHHSAGFLPSINGYPVSSSNKLDKIFRHWTTSCLWSSDKPSVTARPSKPHPRRSGLRLCSRDEQPGCPRTRTTIKHARYMIFWPNLSMEKRLEERNTRQGRATCYSTSYTTHTLCFMP